MFWRLIRSKELDDLLTALRQERQDHLDALAELRQAERKIGEALADARAAQATRDQIVIRINQLEAEQAQVRSRAQGITAVAPQILSGAPSVPSGGTVSFDDVGDERADTLAKAGMLHDTEDLLAVGSEEAMWSRVPTA